MIKITINENFYIFYIIIEFRFVNETKDIKNYENKRIREFREGQEKGKIVSGNVEELISTYLTVFSSVIVLGKGYKIPPSNSLLRIVKNGVTRRVSVVE